jgi:hypothetical protein
MAIRHQIAHAIEGKNLSKVHSSPEDLFKDLDA